MSKNNNERLTIFRDLIAEVNNVNLLAIYSLCSVKVYSADERVFGDVIMTLLYSPTGRQKIITDDGDFHRDVTISQPLFHLKEMYFYELKISCTKSIKI